MTIKDMIQNEIRAAVAEHIKSVLSGVPETASAVAKLVNDADSRGERPVRRARRGKPAVGYHLNVDKPTAKRALKNLAHNPASVLAEIIRKPGQTNRELTVSLADEVPAGKKAIESSLDMLRTIDADGNQLERGSRSQKKSALVVSRELA